VGWLISLATRRASENFNFQLRDVGNFQAPKFCRLRLHGQLQSAGIAAGAVIGTTPFILKTLSAPRHRNG
jgi:hypothetical protein